MHDQSDIINHDPSGESSPVTAGVEAQQAVMALGQHRDLASNLMQKVAHPATLKRAFKSVKRNKGAPGIDKTTIQEIEDDLDQVISNISEQLKTGRYCPAPVRTVEIPKPNGGTRQLGIPTISDRIVQQAMTKVLNDIFDPMFLDSSFGFRPKRSARQAISQAQQYVKDDRIWVVDIDLEKFFDPALTHQSIAN